MADQPYSNREIDRMFKDIMETLARIEAQTIKTNGRVLKLEGQRNWAAGAAAVVIPMFAAILAWISTHVIGFKIN